MRLPGLRIASAPFTYRIARLEHAAACIVPVRPKSEGDCQPRQPDDRTELCATDAWWLLGDLGVCDQHLRYLLERSGDDYDAMLAAYRTRFPDIGDVPNDVERRPWSMRPRRQDLVQTGTRRSSGRAWRQMPGGQAAARSIQRRCGR